MEIARDDIRRFWSLVQITSTCWVWKGSNLSKGYGRFSLNNKLLSAHRFAYELLVADIPEGMQIDHLCERTLCVNPHHMQVVSGLTNLMRGNGRGAINSRKTHCHRGHPFDDENTYLTPTGGRQCLSCKRQWDVTNHDKKLAIGRESQKRYRERQQAKHSS